jgi:glutamate-1-semialdehyde 2,1-aminomutase
MTRTETQPDLGKVTVASPDGAGDGAGQRLYRYAKTRIPSGTQLLSKQPELLLPEQWPSYFSRARGVEVWDLDGRRYVDMAYTAIGAAVLGVGDPDVDEAVRGAIAAGTASTLMCAEEVELADLLCELHPWAEMVRYARGGGEAMAIAVRIARAATGRAVVAFCGYHGWQDWYVAANLAGDAALDGHALPGLPPAGVPRGLMGTAVPFRYNQIEDLRAVVAEHGSRLAAIVMEPVRSTEPAPGFLQGVRALADASGAVLVFDEVTSGFRLNTGGVHLTYGVSPDVAVFAKALGNGYPMAAVIGRREVMRAAEGSFISSTSWTERIGPVAALATLRKHARLDVPAHLIRIGTRVQDGWRTAASRTGLDIEVGGIPPLGKFSFVREDPAEAQALRTLFTQLLLERGYLATAAFYATLAHRDEHVDGYLAAVQDAFARLATALDQGSVAEALHGPVARAGFFRMT